MGTLQLTKHGTFAVLVIDMCHHDPDEDTTVAGFPTLELATEYARRRTRDSLEELRSTARTKEELRKQWYMYGEDCIVLRGEYKGASQIEHFIEHPATAEERDWLAIEKLVSAVKPA